MFALLKKAYPYYGKIYGLLGFCIVLGLFQNILILVEPQIISLMVDRAIAPALGNTPLDNSSIFLFLLDGTKREDVWRVLFILLATFLLFLVLYFITFYTRWNLAHYFSIKLDNQLRLDVLKKIHSFGTRIFDFYDPGELVTISNSDTGKLRDAHIAIIPFMIDSLFAIIAGSFLLSRISILLTLLPLTTLALYLLGTKTFMDKIGALYKRLWGTSAALNTQTQESIYGIRAIKSFSVEALQKDLFGEKNQEVRDCAIELGHTRYRFMLLLNSGNLVVTLISMVLCIFLALHARMTSGEYMAFLSYMLIIVGSFVDLVFFMANLQEDRVSADRVFDLLTRKDEVQQRYGHLVPSVRPDLCLSHLDLVHNQQTLLKDITLSIPYGKKIGIMGRTGSGKSLFFKVLQGLSQPLVGSYLIDGKDCYEYDLMKLTSTFSYAMQNVFLFSTSIQGNIAYGNPDASPEKITYCASLAKVDEFANAMPQGYASLVGEKGFGLSGGQKQRIAIARALLKDAPILLLDDCTSALDLETEHEILTHLKLYARDKTLLMATHRAASIKDFDEILFFEDGRIVEQGTYEQLMALQGRYAAIYQQQGGQNGTIHY